MTRNPLPRSTFANVTSALALVVAVGGGGAYAATLAKNSVGSGQVKNGALKAQDLKAGALTGTQVKDGSITGADIDESTLTLPAAPAAPVAPRVVEGPYTHFATLKNTWDTYASVTFTAPSPGYLRLEAQATLGAGQGAAAGGYIDTLFYIDDDGQVPYDQVGAYTLWGSPDPSGTFVQHPTASDVVKVAAGTHVVTLEMREHLAGSFSTVQNAQIDVQFFPEGSAQAS
jgi:hypothetical protein